MVRARVGRERGVRCAVDVAAVLITAMRFTLLLSGLVFTSHLAAQPRPAPQPADEVRASEVAALQHLRTWLAGPPDVHVPIRPRQLGYDAVVFGFDRNGDEVRGSASSIDPEATSVMMMVPRADALWDARLLFANRAGRIFVGERPADAGADWRPTVATVSGPGVDVHLNNMLLQSGTAVDGTSWLRIDDSPAFAQRPLRVVLRSRDDARVAAERVEIGSSPFLWHPSGVPVADARVVSFHQRVKATDAAEVVLDGRGVAAPGMRLFVPGLRLAATNVTYGEEEVVVTYGRDDLADAVWLEDQAWAVHALRLFAVAQRTAQKECRIDRDRDGVGEFGSPDEVLPAGQRDYQRLKNGRYLFRNHLFEVHVSADADGAEQRFLAYAWPERAHDPHDRAFCIDESGMVRWCAAAGRFAGHEQPPAIGTAPSAWQPLLP